MPQNEESSDIRITENSYTLDYYAYLKNLCAEDGIWREHFCDESPISVKTAQRIRPLSEDLNGVTVDEIDNEALDSLGVQRHRPLINIIGGARNTGQAIENIDQAGDVIAKIAHKYKANVGVPGTQSGIGNTFGRVNRSYQRTFGHLPSEERAHFFAVAPSANIVFRGNLLPLEALAPIEERFAQTPIDTLAVPTSGDWHQIGMLSNKHSYLEHIEYTLSIYAAMSIGRPKIIVVGNGGIWSLIQVNESLKRGFTCILVSDSKRFGTQGSEIRKNIEKLYALTPDERMKSVLDFAQKQKESTFLENDFGSALDTPNNDHRVYREYLNEFISLAKTYQASMFSSPLDSLEGNLETVISNSL